MEAVDINLSYAIVLQPNMEEISYARPQNSGDKKLSKRLIVFGSLFIVVLILIGSAIYFITQDRSPQADEVTKSITLPEDQEITPTPEITDEEELVEDEEDISPTPSLVEEDEEISVSVQNGSGVQGAAGEVASALRSAGFTISSTTNADSTDYTDVTITIKNSQRNSLNDIEEALSQNYVIGSTSTDLPESTSYDVLVIVGS